MTKDELVSIAVERKLVRNKTEARGMKLDALRALVEADAASTGYEHVVEDVNAGLEADAERERAERDLREGRERDEALAAAYRDHADPLDRLDGFVEMRERSHEPKFDTLVLDPAPSLEPPVTTKGLAEGLEFSTVEETKKEAPMNRHQRRRAAALSDKRSMRKARALDLRG